MIVSIGSEGNKIKWTSFGDEPIAKQQSDIVSSTFNPLSGDIITATQSKCAHRIECLLTAATDALQDVTVVERHHR